MSTETRSAIRPSLSEMLFTIFMRMMAVGCFYFGIRYWDLVIGVTSHGAIRFDVLSVPWRTVAASLAVLYPIIALGCGLGRPGAWFFGLPRPGPKSSCTRSGSIFSVPARTLYSCMPALPLSMCFFALHCFWSAGVISDA
jgi:hypothetical protein